MPSKIKKAQQLPIKQKPFSQKKDKHELVQDYVKNLFLSKKLSVNDAIPSERRLAELVKVSYLTARRGVEQLIHDGLCYRVRRKTRIHSNVSSILDSNHINIILSHINPYTIELLEQFKIEAKKMNWEAQILFLHNRNDSRIAKILTSKTPTCILGGIPDINGIVGAALRESQGWVVSVGVGIEGIPSVVSDGSQGIIRALVHLITHGHREISFVTSGFDYDIEAIKSNWRECGLSDQFHGKSFIVKLDLSTFSSVFHAAHAAVIKALRNPKFRPTAFLCYNDFSAVGARHACLDLGLRVPEDVSILSMGSTLMTECCVPQISAIDVDFRGHVTEALNYLKRKKSGKKMDKLLFNVSSKIAERKSVRKLT